MIKFILTRLAQLIPTLFGIITLVFFVIAAIPGDPAQVMMGERANPEGLRKLRKELALDKPPHERYLKYLGNVCHLDFGRSIVTGQKVTDEIMARFPATIEMSFFAMLFAVSLGIFIGVVSATKKNTIIDYSSMVGALVGVSMPVFWLALVLIMIFSVGLDIFPTGGRMDLRCSFTPITNFFILDSIIYLFKKGNASFLLSALHHLILPSLALGSIPLAIIARTTRSSMLEVLKQDYIKTARAAGIPERQVIFKYALKNALLPVITIIGIQFGLLLAGAVLTETIFSWPGIGKWLYHAISARDYPAVQGGIIMISIVFVLINLIVDILYSVINPKIRLK